VPLVDAIIFVVDASDRGRLPEVKAEFSELAPLLPAGAPVLFYLNKQDVPTGSKNIPSAFHMLLPPVVIPNIQMTVLIFSHMYSYEGT